MRAQINSQRAQKGTDKRAQGTDGAQIEKLICAPISPSFYYSFLLKGTKAQNKYKPQDIGKNAKNSRKTAKQGSQKENQRIWFYLCPVPSTAFWGALA